MPELIIILVIVLIIFGAGKLPEIGTGLGKGIGNFRKATQADKEIEAESREAKAGVQEIEEGKPSSPPPSEKS